MVDEQSEEFSDTISGASGFMPVNSICVQPASNLKRKPEEPAIQDQCENLFEIGFPIQLLETGESLSTATSKTPLNLIKLIERPFSAERAFYENNQSSGKTVVRKHQLPLFEEDKQEETKLRGRPKIGNYTNDAASQIKDGDQPGQHKFFRKFIQVMFKTLTNLKNNLIKYSEMTAEEEVLKLKILLDYCNAFTYKDKNNPKQFKKHHRVENEEQLGKMVSPIDLDLLFRLRKSYMFNDRCQFFSHQTLVIALHTIMPLIFKKLLQKNDSEKLEHLRHRYETLISEAFREFKIDQSSFDQIQNEEDIESDDAPKRQHKKLETYHIVSPEQYYDKRVIGQFNNTPYSA